MKRRVGILLYSISRDQKRDFQFKILYFIVFTNEKLFLGVADSPTCALCQTKVEYIEHLLSTFPVKYNVIFGKSVLSWIDGCQFMKSLLKTLQKKMSLLVSSLLEKIFSRLITFCFWVSLIFILGNARIVFLVLSSGFHIQDKAYQRRIYNIEL